MALLPAGLHGCFLGNNQRKVSCWEDGLGAVSLEEQELQGHRSSDSVIACDEAECWAY